MSHPVLECHHICKSYDQGTVLNGVSLALAPGERLALTGPSGCGKTTLLNCLGGIDRPDSGEIRLLGHSLLQLSIESLATLRRKSVGNIFQFFHLLPTLSVRENVEFPLQLLGVLPNDRAARADHLLEKVRLNHRADALPSKLSGGEMQRVAIARALVHQPSLILADEPTGNLDSQNGAIVLELLSELTASTNTALLLVTHSAEATRICHRTIHMRDGLIANAQPLGHSHSS